MAKKDYWSQAIYTSSCEEMHQEFEDNGLDMLAPELRAKIEKILEEEATQKDEDDLVAEDIDNWYTLLSEEYNLNESISDDEFENIQPGDFILAKTYSDIGKLAPGHDIRPMLVVNKSGARTYCFPITSTAHDSYYDALYIELTNDLVAGTGLSLKNTSWLSIQEQQRPDKTAIIAVIGHTNKELLALLGKKLSKLLWYRNILMKLTYDIAHVRTNVKSIK